MKTCKECCLEQDDACFAKNRLKCKGCISSYQKRYYQENKQEISNKHRRYYEDNRDNILLFQQGHRVKNRTKRREYEKSYEQENRNELRSKKRERRRTNGDKIRMIDNAYQKERRTNPSIRLRQSISRSINRILEQNGFTKNGESCSKYLPFTKEELNRHIEDCFRLSGNEWMNWNNHGCYSVNTWDDDNSDTWTWQLDHIIPHSTFNYTSIDCQEFRDCWALSNLRPLSAKQNILDGSKRTRHKKKI